MAPFNTEDYGDLLLRPRADPGDRFEVTSSD